MQKTATLKEEIQGYLKAQGISLSELAMKSQVSSATFERILNKKNYKINRQTFGKLKKAGVLDSDVEIKDFIWKGSNKKSEKTKPSYSVYGIEDLLNVFLNLSKNERENLVTYAKFLISQGD